MDRRDFLKSTGAAAAVVSVAGGAEASAGTLSGQTSDKRDGDVRALVLGTSFDLTRPGPGDWARRLHARLSEIGAGTFDIRIVETRGGTADAAMLGDTDLILTRASADISFDAAFAAFSGLPGRTGMDGREHAAWLSLGGGQMLWDDLAADFGIKPLLAGMIDAPSRLVTSAPLDLDTGLDGARISADGIARMIGIELGAIPVPLAPRDIPSALSAGHIAAADRSNPFPDAGWNTPGLIHYASGLGAPAEALVLGVRSGLWQRLTPVERTMIEMAASESTQFTLAESRTLEMFERAANGAGPRLPPSIARQIARATDAVIEGIVSQSPHARRIYDSQRAFSRMIDPPGAMMGAANV